MAIIDDVSKLRPELLDKSLNELARLKAEIEMAQAEVQRREDVKAKEALADEANAHIDAVVTGVKWLHTNGILPGKLTEAFSRGDGVFTPATVLRNVTAEQLVPSQKKTRRPRLTGAAREAAIAAGTLKPRKRRAS